MRSGSIGGDECAIFRMLALEGFSKTHPSEQGGKLASMQDICQR